MDSFYSVMARRCAIRIVAAPLHPLHYMTLPGVIYARGNLSYILDSGSRDTVVFPCPLSAITRHLQRKAPASAWNVGGVAIECVVRL